MLDSSPAWASATGVIQLLPYIMPMQTTPCESRYQVLAGVVEQRHDCIHVALGSFGGEERKTNPLGVLMSTHMVAAQRLRSLLSAGT
jgi:hypothetical protein